MQNSFHNNIEKSERESGEKAAIESIDNNITEEKVQMETNHFIQQNRALGIKLCKIEIKETMMNNSKGIYSVRLLAKHQ